jgi:hypothetical protein
MKMRGLGLVLAVAGSLAPGAQGQTPAPDGGADRATAETTELVNTLLGALMGPGNVTGPELQAAVAEVGGIPFRRDVPIAFMERRELAEYLREVLDSDYPEDQAEADERLLRAFDLLDASVDLRALRARVLEENVVGFYDERPGRRRLFAVSEDEAFTPMNQIVLVHELRHALQDQYQDLHLQLPEDVGDFDDRRLAWLCLLEGDATLVMQRFVLDRLGKGGPAASGGPIDGGYSAVDVPGLLDMPGTPAVIKDQLVMPYLVGAELARAIDARGGPEAMKGAWRRPPASTEQVLHPDKFFRREPPLVVTPRRAPPGGRLISEGVLGELLLRTLVEEVDEAAAGWGGDAWRLWDVEGRTVLLWRSAWDTAEDASEFDVALARRFARRCGRGATYGPWTVFAGRDGWRFASRLEGDVVELVSGDGPSAFEALLE